MGDLEAIDCRRSGGARRRGEPAEIAEGFARARKAHVDELLETLVAVGQARLTDDGRFVA